LKQKLKYGKLSLFDGKRIANLPLRSFHHKHKDNLDALRNFEKNFSSVSFFVIQNSKKLLSYFHFSLTLLVFSCIISYLVAVSPFLLNQVLFHMQVIFVFDGVIVGRGFNSMIRGHDPSAHAEIQAIRQAAASVGNYRLNGAEVFVTLEPCSMCAGAMVHARIARLVFGTREPKAGVVVSNARFFEQLFLNHQIEVSEGIHNSHSVVSKLIHGNLDFLFLPDFRLVEKNAVNKSLQACSWIPSLTSI
jgi:tRNA(adenine34) deaminase